MYITQEIVCLLYVHTFTMNTLHNVHPNLARRKTKSIFIEMQIVLLPFPVLD